MTARYPAGLSVRHRAILERVAQGETSYQIAYELGCSPATVKNHLTVLFKRLGAVDRTSAVVIATRRGLLDIGIPATVGRDTETMP